MVSQETIYREASHYNSWYYGPKETLANEIKEYCNKAEALDQSKNKLKGMIVPHAGVMWSGPTAVWGFKNLVNKKLKRIFILGPSHFVEFPGCGLTTADYWKTPFCNLKVDREVFSDLKKLNTKDKPLFLDLPMDIDLYEHSLEIQTPYLGYFLQDKASDITIVPILTGKLSYEEELIYAKTLSDYYGDDDNIFVISEDFCHWGKRHKLQFQYEHCEKIYQSIEFLDQMAFDIIAKQNSKEFSEYLSKWKNNLCGGGSPVTIYLAIVENYIKSNKEKNKENKQNMRLMHYTKSNPKIEIEKEESVSYAVFLDYIE